VVALAGASAPQLAHMLKPTEGRPVVNTIAHAILDGAVAALQDNNAAAVAMGAEAGEVIARQLYPDVRKDKLTEEEKQTISALASISAGIAGGLRGDSALSAATGAQAGKNAVENIALSVPNNKSRSQEMAQCQGSAFCEKGVIDKYKKSMQNSMKALWDVKVLKTVLTKPMRWVSYRQIMPVVPASCWKNRAIMVG
jgi:filamentous hemagglutinin